MEKYLATTSSVSANAALKLPGRVVLAPRGGGAWGAYQGGIYDALHEAGIEPTASLAPRSAPSMPESLPPEKRLEHPRQFWATIEYKPSWENALFLAPFLSGPHFLEDLTSQSGISARDSGGWLGCESSSTEEDSAPRTRDNWLLPEKVPEHL